MSLSARNEHSDELNAHIKIAIREIWASKLQLQISKRSKAVSVLNVQRRWRRWEHEHQDVISNVKCRHSRRRSFNGEPHDGGGRRSHILLKGLVSRWGDKRDDYPASRRQCKVHSKLTAATHGKFGSTHLAWQESKCILRRRQTFGIERHVVELTSIGDVG